MWPPFGHRNPSQCFLRCLMQTRSPVLQRIISLNNSSQACSGKHSLHYMDEEREAQSWINLPWANSWNRPWLQFLPQLGPVNKLTGYVTSSTGDFGAVAKDTSKASKTEGGAFPVCFVTEAQAEDVVPLHCLSLLLNEAEARRPKPRSGSGGWDGISICPWDTHGGLNENGWNGIIYLNV